MIHQLNSQAGQTATGTDMTGSKKNKKIYLYILIAAAGIAAVLYALWKQGCFLPHWIEWKNASFLDHSGKYEIVLDHRTVSVLYDSRIIWNTPDGVKVQDVLSCDIDGDDKDELILLCWKVGRYGRYRPFWVEKDERNWSQHIFVYEFQENQVRPKWMSSYIGQDVVKITVNNKKAPFDRLLLTDTEGIISSWVWDSWGFKKENTNVKFTVFGDNLIHEPIYRYGLQNEGNFDFLYENVKAVVSESDIAVINQETPLVDLISRYHDYPRFGTPIEVGEAIVDAGFDVVTCATNHALDQGIYGIHITKDYFDSKGVMCLGIQTEQEKEYRPYEILVKKGIKFALFNYTYGTNGITLPDGNSYMVHLLDNSSKVRDDISKARQEADFIIIFVHWGTQDSKQIDEFQREWTKVFLESKADVVVGTHPHVLQPYEVIRDEDGHEMLVYYSIGNYISAQPQKECIKGGMASFTVGLGEEGYRVVQYDLEPLQIVWQERGKYRVNR